MTIQQPSIPTCSPVISRDLPRSPAISRVLPAFPPLGRETLDLSTSGRSRREVSDHSFDLDQPFAPLSANRSSVLFPALSHVAPLCVFFSHPPAPPMGLRRCPDRQIIVFSYVLCSCARLVSACVESGLGCFACTAPSLPYPLERAVCVSLAQPASRTSPRSSHSNARDSRVPAFPLSVLYSCPSASLARVGFRC